MVRRPAIVTDIIITIIAAICFAWGSVLRVWMVRRPAIVIAFLLPLLLR